MRFDKQRLSSKAIYCKGHYILQALPTYLPTTPTYSLADSLEVALLQTTLAHITLILCGTSKQTHFSCHDKIS
jgi:hypothetical protein